MECTLRLCGKVFDHITLVDWWSESVHIGIDGHPIEESEIFSCYLLNGVCRTLWSLF